MPIYLYPLYFLYFWYFYIPKRLIHTFVDVILYFFQLLSVPLLIKTFFRPLKNEYRGDLVIFSIGMGIVVKTVLIPISLLLIAVVVMIEVFIFAVIMLTPLLPIYFLIR